MSHPLDIQGHRGARGLRPENTLPAFDLALELGVTTLELDVGITADRVLVVCHDPMLNPRLCLDREGRSLLDTPLRIKDLTLAQVQTFDCGSLNPDPARFPHQQACPGAQIPTLQQVFDLAEARNPAIRYNIETKVNPLKPDDTWGPEEFASRLVALVEQNGLTDRVTVQSFDWRVLRRVRQLQASLQTVALIHHAWDGNSTLRPPSPWLDGLTFGGDIPNLLQTAGYIDCYSPNWETLLPESPDFLQPLAEIQQAGFPVIPWTVNDSALMQRLIAMGVDGLITDFPDVLLKVHSGSAGAEQTHGT